MALRLALDSNRYVDFRKGEPTAVRLVQLADEVVLPIITVAELRAGFVCGTRRESNERELAQLIRERRVTLVAPDEATTHFYARIYADLRAAGTPIPTNDMWIAALVMQHDLVLSSRDAHFDHVRQIARM